MPDNTGFDDLWQVPLQFYQAFMAARERATQSMLISKTEDRLAAENLQKRVEWGESSKDRAVNREYLRALTEEARARAANVGKEGMSDAEKLSKEEDLRQVISYVLQKSEQILSAESYADFQGTWRRAGLPLDRLPKKEDYEYFMGSDAGIDYLYRYTSNLCVEAGADIFSVDQNNARLRRFRYPGHETLDRAKVPEAIAKPKGFQPAPVTPEERAASQQKAVEPVTTPGGGKIDLRQPGQLSIQGAVPQAPAEEAPVTPETGSRGKVTVYFQGRPYEVDPSNKAYVYRPGKRRHETDPNVIRGVQDELSKQGF